MSTMSKFTRVTAAMIVAVMWLGLRPANTADTPIPLDTVKQAINATAANWIAFRNFKGRQLVYFTQVLTWKCGLSAVRYAINSSHIDRTWPLPPCNPQNPYQLDPTTDQVYESFPLGSVTFVSVQIVFADGTATEVMTYVPCEGVGEGTCARMM